MGKVYSSEGCADAMVADGYAAEADNYIDNATIQQQHEEIERLRAENDRQRRALLAVETWWLEDGMKNFDGAPYCIFAVRAALRPVQ